MDRLQPSARESPGRLRYGAEPGYEQPDPRRQNGNPGPHENLRSEIQQWCEESLDKSSRYLEIAKMSSNVWWDLLYSHFIADMHMLKLAVGSEDMVEGATAFVRKRKPDFRRFRR